MTKQNKAPLQKLPLQKGSEGHLTIGFLKLIPTKLQEEWESYLNAK